MTEETMDHKKLNELYVESESCDKDVLAEMKSNILLHMGKHFSKLQRRLDYRLREAQAPKNTRVRLTKNHLGKAVDDLIDILASMTPGVLPYPKNEAELGDQRAAELSKLVWEHGEEMNDWDDLVSRLRYSFAVVGEVATETFFDPTKGGIKDYEQMVDDDGQPVYQMADGQLTLDPVSIDPMTGMPIAQHNPAKDEKKPIFRGKLCIKKIFPANLRRAKNAQTIKDSPYLINVDMMPLKDVHAFIRANEPDTDRREELLRLAQESSETSFQVFDGTSGSFQDSKGQIVVRKFYFRPCAKYPSGYYYFALEEGVIAEGEIPFGDDPDCFPIEWEGYNCFETSARGFSPIKKVRNVQAEISRTCSAMAETQLTIGYDKIVLNKGAKFSRGVDQPGLRVFHASGEKPMVINGRSGEQFLPTYEKNVAELYQLLNVPENSNPAGQAFDIKAELFKKQSQRIRFTQPAEKFARFLVRQCRKYLILAQKYYDEDDLVHFIGQSQAPDIAEFKNVDHLRYAIKLKEVSDDLETMMGKTVELETILQYLGKDLDEQTSSILISQFPILNKSQALQHLTMEVDNVESDMMAIERGEPVQPHPSDDHELHMKYLVHRMKRRDFRMLDPQIQQLFQQKYQAHEMLSAQAAEALRQAQMGFIPTGGTLAKADLYVNTDPANPSKVTRATFPIESLQWLKEMLDKQGMAQERLSELSPDVQAQVLNQQGPLGSVGSSPLQGVMNGNGNPAGPGADSGATTGEFGGVSPGGPIQAIPRI